MEVSGWLGPLVVVAIALVGAIGGYFTYKAKVDELNKRGSESAAVVAANSVRIEVLERDQQARVTTIGEKLVQLELRVERECVKKDDLERVEDRISRRIDSIAHDLKGATAQIIAALTIRPRPPKDFGQ